MPGGRTSKALKRGEVQALNDYRVSHRFSLPQLKLHMEAPFRWQVLKRALQGDAVWELNHKFIVEWMEKHITRNPDQSLDYKSRAAGESVEHG